MGRNCLPRGGRASGIACSRALLILMSVAAALLKSPEAVDSAHCRRESNDGASTLALKASMTNPSGRQRGGATAEAATWRLTSRGPSGLRAGAGASPIQARQTAESGARHERPSAGGQMEMRSRPAAPIRAPATARRSTRQPSWRREQWRAGAVDEIAGSIVGATGRPGSIFWPATTPHCRRCSSSWCRRSPRRRPAAWPGPLS